MALLGSTVAREVGLRLLLCPLGSNNIVIRTACCSVGIVLPVYSTFKAIERKDQNEEQRWLLYWAAYGSFSLVEVFADKLISWSPLYYHLKFAFLVWLQFPSSGGARHLYMCYLRPFFLRHQARIDQVVGSAYGEMNSERSIGFLDLQVKLMSSHQAEIQAARTLFTTIMASANQILRGEVTSVQPQSQNVVEGQRRIISDSGSDLDD
ncbi:HVA22-like protein k isoform X1 [Vitis vinifera]|uniref:HVA22-like protein k isoform X1 n=1 Tax=Vitis vinifera TaxID=29760 RepID=UPI0005402779|nr:HVA22-like protein k isoform X1 [Vitis vinifera]|eukprot:XP_010649178.1 PREDICTED: HVA22-like protein k isoform X1 [Vitis vinifera]